MHQLDQAFSLHTTMAASMGKTSTAYQNMIGPYGGITAAAMLKAMQAHPERQGEPLTLTVIMRPLYRMVSMKLKPNHHIPAAPPSIGPHR